MAHLHFFHIVIYRRSLFSSYQFVHTMGYKLFNNFIPMPEHFWSHLIPGREYFASFFCYCGTKALAFITANTCQVGFQQACRQHQLSKITRKWVIIKGIVAEDSCFRRNDNARYVVVK